MVVKKSILLHVLDAFSKKELRELRKWLQSPIHNQREDVLALFTLLVDQDLLGEDKNPAKELLFEFAYPDAPFDDARLRQTMHFLLKATEEYLLHQELMNDEVQGRILLARVYQRRQLNKSFQRAIDQAESLQERLPYRNRQYLQNAYFLEYERYTYLSGLRRTVPLNLQEVGNALDVSYLASKLRLACLMLAHQTVYKADYDTGLLEEVLQLVEDKHYTDIPAIAIYYYSYKALKSKDDETYFNHLKKQIFDHGDLFPESEIRDIYLLSINYCIGRMNAGVEGFVRQAFDLYKHGLEKKILIQNGLVSRWTFRNVVTNGTMLKEFEWTERFIQNYQQYLEDQYRENIVHYSMAKLHFEKKEYDQSMRLLAQMEYDDILMNLAAKTMLLKMYYERDELDALDSLLESMRVYMRRKKVIGYHKSNYQSIISLTRKLTHLNLYDKDSTKRFREEVLATNPLTERRWLLEQVKGD
jgi:hypothetical protein